MLNLMLTPRSPFARRVRLALLRTKIPFTEQMVDPFNPSDEFLTANPLGLVPVLLGMGSHPIIDSATILDELHMVHGGIWPETPAERTRVRYLSTLAEGVMSAAVAYYLEGLKPNPDPETRTEHSDVIRRTLGVLAAESVPRGSQADWDLACALDYVSLRLPELEWRKTHATLVECLDRAQEDPNFAKTRPPAA